MRRFDELRLAVMLCTRLPAGKQVADPDLAASVWAYPLVGALLGAITALVMILASTVLPTTLAAGLALMALVAMTGGMHEDGLADTADGFGGGRDRERKLEIMHDSRVGTYGALALILSLGLRWMAFVHVGAIDTITPALVAAGASSRAAMALVLATTPPARQDGLGALARAPATDVVLLALAIALFPLLHYGWGLLLLVLVVSASFGLVRHLAMRQIGGFTGDVLGAVQQVSEIAVLLAIVALSP